jgi:hypothetical protein
MSRGVCASRVDRRAQSAAAIGNVRIVSFVRQSITATSSSLPASTAVPAASDTGSRSAPPLLSSPRAREHRTAAAAVRSVALLVHELD